MEPRIQMDFSQAEFMYMVTCLTLAEIFRNHRDELIPEAVNHIMNLGEFVGDTGAIIDRAIVLGDAAGLDETRFNNPK